ncbi:MAG: primosomal protein N', partial [Cycloclasticus sp.]
MSKFYLNIAVDTPLHRVFDYLPLEQSKRSDYTTGQRVIIPFGRQQKTGIILKVTSKTELSSKQLKPISELLDQTALLCEQDITLYKWTADYYHHPIGEVFAQALPKQIRSGKSSIIALTTLYSLSDSGLVLKLDDLKRSPRQAALWKLMNTAKAPTDNGLFANIEWDWRAPLKSMMTKGWVITSQEQTPSLYQT